MTSASWEVLLNCKQTSPPAAGPGGRLGGEGRPTDPPRGEDLAGLLDALPQGVLVLDGELTVLFSNQTAGRALGMSPGQALAPALEPGQPVALAGAMELALAEAPAGREFLFIPRLPQGPPEPLPARLSAVRWGGAPATLLVFTPPRDQAWLGPYRDFFHLSQSGMAVYDPYGRARLANDRLSEILGYSKEELAQLTWDRFTHPEDLLHGQAKLTSLLAGETDHFAVETRLVRKDKRIIHARVLASRPRSWPGQPPTVLIWCEDISDHKAARRALAQSENRFRVLFEQAPMAYQAMDATGRLREVNQRWLATLGYRKEEVLGRFMEEFLTPDSREKLQQGRLHLRLEGELYGLELEMAHKEGRLITVRLDCAAEHDADRHFRYTHCVFQDISERKAVQAALRQSEQRYRTLVMALPSVVAVLQGPHFVYLNPAARRIMGITPSGADTNLDAWQFVHPDDKEMVRGRLARASQGQANPSVDLRIVKPDGGIRILQSLSVPIVYQDRPAVVIIANDVTENREMEQERDQTLEVLRLVNQADGMEELARLVTRSLKDWLGVDAVGLRLRQGDDFPYFHTEGFSAEFVAAENSLCKSGRGQSGQGFLDCMCGVVLENRTDPALPFFTRAGSFVTPSTSRLLRESDGNLPPDLRNRCHGSGYESVTLIPLRFNDESLGLLQLNDRREGVFEPQTVSALERIANQLSVAVARQQTEEKLKGSLAEKEVLLREIHHRVKNNMQVISSLLSLQSADLDSPAFKRPFLQCRNRVRAMALIHETLYQGPSLAHIDMADYLTELARGVVAGAGPENKRPILKLKLAHITLDMDQAVPAGLVVNELISNAVQHGAPIAGRARIEVTAGLTPEGEVEMTVKDNGPGLPAGLDPAAGATLGLNLITGLTEKQLNGRWSIESQGGLKVVLRWPR